MSEIQFSGYRTPYDEEQAFQRHKSILKTKSKLSKDMQQSVLNDQLNIAPVMQVPKTASEILNDEAQVNKMVQQYIIEWFPDSPNLVKNFGETEVQFDMRKYPAKYIFNTLTQIGKKFLVEQYPAIKTDLQQVGVLTPQYFINFLQNYTAALQKSGGVNRFSNFKGIDEIKGLINNLPSKSDITNILNLVKDVRDATPEIDRKLDEMFYLLNQKISHMISIMPTNRDINDLEMAIQQNGLTSEIQQILDTLETLPTSQQLGAIGTTLLDAIENNDVAELKDKIQEILVEITDNQLETQDMKDLLGNIKRNVSETKRNIVDLNQKANIRLKEGVVKEIYDRMIQNRLDEFNEEIESENALITKQNEAINKRNEEKLQRNNLIVEERSDEIAFTIQYNKPLSKDQRLPIPKPIKPTELEPYEKPFPLLKILQSISNLPKEVVRQAQEDAQILAMQEAQKEGMEDVLSSFTQDVIPATYQASQYQQQPIGQEQQQSENPTTNEQKGNGLANRIKNKIQPKFITRQKMIGKGITVDSPKYIEFGKFCISIADLNNDVLRVKYQTTMVDVPNFKNKVSSDFVDFLNNFIETQKISERQLEKLPKEEQKIFRNLINKSGLNVKYKVKDYKTVDETAEEDRFNLVKGQYMAGNDNPRVKDELRKFIIKFMMENKINKKEGQEILFQLSM